MVGGGLRRVEKLLGWLLLSGTMSTEGGEAGARPCTEFFWLKVSSAVNTFFFLKSCCLSLVIQSLGRLKLYLQPYSSIPSSYPAEWKFSQYWTPCFSVLDNSRLEVSSGVDNLSFLKSCWIFLAIHPPGRLPLSFQPACRRQVWSGVVTFSVCDQGVFV